MKRVRVNGKADALQLRTEQIESGYYWQKNVKYDSDYSLSDRHKLLSDQLFKSLQLLGEYKLEQKKKDFETLLANLLFQTRKSISISLNKTDWKQTRYNNSSYTTIKEIITTLHSKKLIDMKRGYHCEEDSKITRISATEKLLDYFPEYKRAVIYKPKELVILRDSKRKLKDYKDTAETWRIRTILTRANDVNSKADIRYQNDKLTGFLLAIFREKFTWYGRLHTKGYRHYQGLSKDERKEITINGDPIAEIDYSGLHPNLLYAQEGIQLSCDPYMIINKNPVARPFLKQILLSMLNAKDFITAERAANNWLRLNERERQALTNIGITRARPLMEKFLTAHAPISHYFCNGKDTGMRIMNKDAKIALDIVNHFVKQGIPILAVHDSFIVQELYSQELYEVMKTTYQKHTGFDIKIK